MQCTGLCCGITTWFKHTYTSFLTKEINKPVKQTKKKSCADSQKFWLEKLWNAYLTGGAQRNDFVGEMDDDDITGIMP